MLLLLFIQLLVLSLTKQKKIEIMYDLQKILLDNYCKKNNVEISKRELSKDGTWFYWLKMTWDAECKEFVYSCYITAFLLFPERFDLDTEVSEQSQFYPCEY